MIKIGQTLLGTDGQAYRVRSDLRIDQGSLSVVGKDVCIPFSPKSLEVYERYGCPTGFNSSDKLFLLKDSEKQATRLWKAKEKILKKTINEVVNLTTI